MANDFYGKGEYNFPSTSNYYRFLDGDNRFRILGAFSEGTAIQGIEYWKTINGTRKPIRIHRDQTVPVEELELNKFGDPDIPKFFWAFPVWNYEEKRVQILEITQKSILNYIKKVIDNPKWGDPRNFDFIVTREKQGEKVVYTVTNDPKEKLDKSIVELYTNTFCKIQRLFDGLDPWNANLESEKDLIDDADKALS